MTRNKLQRALASDFLIILGSIIFAMVLVRTDLLIHVLTSTQELKFVGSFIAGLFFTSVFTTAPAIVTLGEIAQEYSLFLTALFGATGAVVGDMIIFTFIKDHFSEHLRLLFATRGSVRRFSTLFKRRSFRWLTFMAGGLIIASPLPDELGISLLGFSHMKASRFIVLSFCFNFLGIVLIGLAARALL